jgi:hypothetical protein
MAILINLKLKENMNNPPLVDNVDKNSIIKELELFISNIKKGICSMLDGFFSF